MAPRIANPCSYLPRRLQIVFSLALVIVTIVIIFGSTTSYDIPYKEELSREAGKAADYLPKNLPKISTPPWFNPFKAPAHQPPPVQANSTSGEAKWFSDWKWQNPFSSSITLDENRAVLPPLNKRTPVYTYYDAVNKKSEEFKKAEHELLVIWRRAWWAKGFRPVVLGRPEALNNPLYRSMQNLELEPGLENDLMRWLAWGNMGTGVLANWLVVPMASSTDPLLSFLRYGEFPQLTRYEGLENGLLVGSKDEINKAIEVALASKQPIKAETLVQLVPKATFNVDAQHDGVAFYSTDTIIKKYKGLAEKLLDKEEAVRAEGLAQLPELINSHLHMTWQNTFSSGIAVLKSLPDHTSSMVHTSVELARNLSQCSDSPYPSSCPPNRPRCKPCVSAPMAISIPELFKNSSKIFTIGTVPHPYTLLSLIHGNDALSTRFIRRQTTRDPWITAATKEFLGTGVSAYNRLTDMKDAIASTHGSANSLWLTAERLDDAALHEDLAWILGFPVPTDTDWDGKSETPVPGPERRPPAPTPEGKIPDEVELEKERRLIDKSRLVVGNARGSTRAQQQARDVVEAWNLADTELWRFVRAYGARRRVERRKWEEEERKFAGSEAKGTWGRWFDRREN